MTEESDSEKILEDSLLRCFSPIYWSQVILASVRVNIKDNVVTLVTVRQNLYSMLWLVLFTFSYSFFIDYYQREYYHRNTMMYLSCIFCTFILYASYFLTNFLNRFTQRDDNVKIYIMLQKVDRVMKLDQYYANYSFRLSVVILVAMLIGFPSGFYAHASSLLDKPSYSMFYGFGILTVHIDILLGISMIYFLAIRVHHFNRIIKNKINEYRGVEITKPTMALRAMAVSLLIPYERAQYEALTHDKWLECLQQILKCYKLVTKLYSFSMLIFSVSVVTWTYVAIGGLVVGYRSGLYPLWAFITIIMFGIYYYVQLTVLVIINDWFIQEVVTMKRLCIRLISYDYYGPSQKTASEIIRTIHYEKPAFSVYGIFVVDRRLPLKIINVIASNALVIIQFAIHGLNLNKTLIEDT